MGDVLLYSSLDSSHSDELVTLLLNGHVFAFIGGQPPTPERYRKRIQSILSGAPTRHPGVKFRNYVVRLAATGELVGTLEATLHDGIAEVAYLFGPMHWGKGYAAAGLSWLGAELLQSSDTCSLWATTDPRNHRSIGLLAKCGYSQVKHELAPELYSYVNGDLVFARKSVG